MEQLEKYFPVGNSVAPINKDDVTTLVVAIVIYVIVAAVMGVITWALGGIPVLGLVVSIIGGLVALYVVVGIVLSVVKFVK